MSSLTSVTLKNRRQALQNQRRLKYWQAVWRSLIACSLATGLFWTIALPEWAIEKETQIEIEGNQFLSEAELRQLLAFTYPQPILELQTQPIVEKLKSAAPIEAVAVTRQLFPPKLTIEVRERPPVAIALAPEAKSSPGATAAIGYLDERGILIPQDFYSQMDEEDLPALKVIGFTNQYHPYWSELYRLVTRSSVQVEAIDWRDPSNLKLKTELGMVHLGSNPWQLSEQLAVLSRLRPLSARLKTDQVVSIDLTNPSSPAIELIESSEQE